MHGFIWFLLACLVFTFYGSTNVTRFVYDTEPNEGSQTINGIAQGNQFLAPFEYRVEVEPQFTSGQVEVVFYNQFGQILHPTTIIHPPSNQANVDPPPVFNSPTMPMLEGRTQLLAWARIPAGSQVIQVFPPDTTIITDLNGPMTAACEGLPTPPPPNGDPDCEIRLITPTGLSFSRFLPRDGSEVAINPFGGVIPAGTTVTVFNELQDATIKGRTLNPGPWVFGPHIFQQGTDAGEFIFIDSDQGPPASPFINEFICQGVGNCVDSPLLVDVPRPLLDPQNNRFRYKVVFNKRDIFNATNSLGTGVPLTVAFSGFVNNDPSLWRGPDGSAGLPGANSKPESNAFVDSFLIPVRFTQSVAPEQDIKTSGTGPFPIAVTGVNPVAPQVVYPDNVNNHPYGSPVYPSQNPFPQKYPYGPSLSPGDYQTFSYNFTSLIDGDYEIWVGAEDVTSTITLNGQSPGEVNQSGQRVPGTTTVISVIKDGVAPNSFSVQLEPTDKYLILGDNDDPPLPYDEFQGEIFRVRGTFSDEREDVLTMTFDLTRDDGLIINRPGKNGHYEQVNTVGNFYSSFFDFSPEDPPTTGSPAPPHSPTGGQRGYQMTVYPIDPQENVSETTKAIYIIKDLVAPQDPVFSSPPTSTVVTSSFMTVLVTSPNLNVATAPFLDFREHGLVNMNLSVIDSSGRATQFSSGGRSFIGTNPVDSSKLDDHPSWDKPPGLFGGNGVTGKDFFQNVPERFEFSQRFSLTDLAEGPVDLIVALVDQVGNTSATTSIQIIKNSTGPSVVFNDADRQNSGPDNNYPVPNFKGADDDYYVVSMISPEMTVDFGNQLTPGDPDPGSQDSLYVEGLAIDAVTDIDRVQIRSLHIPATLATLSNPGLPVSTFSVNLDIRNLPEGIPEVVSFQAFDTSDIPGNPTSISIYRDTTPADPPILLSPARLVTDSVIRVYSASDRVRLYGQMSAKDSPIISIPSGEILRSKIVVLTPPDSSPFVTGDIIPRILKSSPTEVPRLDSFNSSFPVSANQAHFDYREANESGFWELETFIGNVPVSYSVPTTIYIQGIDQFDNTDPDSSVTPVEVFYFPNGGLAASLSLQDFRGTGQDVQIFPPDSLPGSVLETLYLGIEKVQLQLRTLIPMIEAPELSVKQFNAETKVATLLGSVDQVKGQTVFDYSYSILPAMGRYDGVASVRIDRGRDLFGNSIQEKNVTTAFYVDSLAPNIITTSPDYVPTEVQPVFEPSMGSRVRIQGVTISVSFSDFLTSNGSLNRSGIDTQASSISLFGPLKDDPEKNISVQPMSPLTDYDLSVRVVDPMIDGVYRIKFEAVDRVGNTHRFYSSIVFDQTPIAGPLLVTDPSKSSIISMFPSSGVSQYLDLRIDRIDVDLQASDFDLKGPDGQVISLLPKQIIEPNLIRRYLSSPIPEDGSADGEYLIGISAVDLAGNSFDGQHSFLFDSKAPISDKFLPKENTCNGPKLDIFDLLVRDMPGREDIQIPTSGIDQRSNLRLKMLEPSYPRSERKTGEFFVGESQLLSVPEGNSIATRRLAFIPSKNSSLDSLRLDGQDDGKLVLMGEVYDSVGNLHTTSSSFYYDTQSPLLKIDSFSDYKLVGVTSGFDLNIGGVISDDGPCHFNVSGEAYNGFTTLTLSVYNYDIDLESVSGVLISTLEVNSLSPIEFQSYPYHSSQVRWEYSTFTAFQGSPNNRYYQLNLEASDQAGNKANLSRVFQLVNHNQATPTIIHPPLESVIDGQISTFRSKDSILTIKWQNISGVELVELEVYRKSLSSVLPIHRVTYSAAKQTSDLLSLNVGLDNSESALIEVTGLELFQYRIRGLDGEGRASGWSPYYDYEVDRRPLHVDRILLRQNTGLSDLSATGAFLSTPVFDLEVVMNKRFSKEIKGLVEFYIPDWGLELSLDTEPRTTRTTDRFFATGVIPLRPSEDFPKEKSKLHIGGFRDLVGQSMQPFDQDVPMDFGPDTIVQFFSNPVAQEELVSVISLVSHNGKLEPIVVRRQDGQIVSPSILLRKGGQERVLSPLPLNETVSDISGLPIAASFSVPMNVTVSDVGFYYLMIDYEDQFGRTISKQKEVSLGSFRTSRAFQLTGGKGVNLSYSGLASRVDRVGVVAITEPSSYVSSSSGPWRLKGDFNWIASTDSLRGIPIQIRLSSKLDSQISSHTVLLKKDLGRWVFDQKLSRSKTIQTSLGIDYMMAEDLYPPEILWRDKMSLRKGSQKLPFELADRGSGIDFQNLRIFLDGVNLRWSKRNEELFLDIPGSMSGGEKILEVAVSDRSGRNLQVSKAVQVFSGTGVKWAYVVPNPVRDVTMNLNYYLEGSVQSGIVKIYDVSGRRVYQEDLNTVPGNNRWIWDLSNSDGIDVSNGVYFFKIEVIQQGKRYSHRGKFVLLR